VRSPRGTDQETLTHRFLDRLGEAQREVTLLSPYFIPDAAMMERLQSLRARGVSIRVVTNSLAVSDEPFVSVALERHQRELLSIGVDLYELSSTQVKLDSNLRTLFGASIGRLHAKMAVIDRHIVYVGSLNSTAGQRGSTPKSACASTAHPSPTCCSAPTASRRRPASTA
jgi:phosphatidylserine/phosphatidylglycerophosphate/cardiolipin synthase-like enzyme